MSPTFGLFYVIDSLLNLVKWAIILAVVFDWLVVFRIIDTRNRLVWTIGDFLHRMTDPLLSRIRNILPSIGQVDISPIILVLGIEFIVRPALWAIYRGIATGVWTLV